jgi:cell division protein FtsI (penicillin-binding protein 3)
MERWESIEKLELAGVGAEPARERVYPLGSLAGQLIGFTGIDGQGLEGIEQWLDKDLCGEADALQVERDARGRQLVLGDVWRPLPRVGARVELTIDARLQHVVEKQLADAVAEFDAVSGTAIVMAPHSGEILAMATVPRFDPNHFGDVAPQLWRNRAVTDLYEPGSTLKVFLAAAALQRGVVRPEDPIDCERGLLRVANSPIRDHHPYSVISFADVIAHSSNIGCAKVGARLGREALAATLADFGFGQLTGIGFPGEAAGLVRPVESWRAIDLATASFGQGLAVTPLQLVRAFAAVANGGELMRPILVRRVVTPEGVVLTHNPPVVLRRVLSAETSRTLTDILVRVVDSGTGKTAGLDGFAVAGKTGTSQKVDSTTGRYHLTERVSSFAGYVPAHDPELAVVVVVDTPRRHSTYGSVVAAPVFRRIAEYGLALRGVLPQGDSLRQRQERPTGLVPVAYAPSESSQLPAHTGPPAPSAAGEVPNLLGLSMRDALVRAQQLGWKVRIDGSGYVIRQEPEAGEPIRDPARPVVPVLALQFGLPLP